MKTILQVFLLFILWADPVIGQEVLQRTEICRPGDVAVFAFEQDAEHWSGEAVLTDYGGNMLSAARGFSLADGRSGRRAMVFLLGVPNTAFPGEYAAGFTLKGRRIDEVELPLTIESRDFISEDIHLNPALTSLMTEPDPQIEIDAQEMVDLLGRFETASVFTVETHIEPVKEYRKSSFFGDRRQYIYTNGYTGYSVHTGIDMAAPRGTGIYASAAGRVVMSKDRVITGKTILIEHLPGLFSVYFHMDKLAVVIGDYVEQGQFIGTMGSTGLSTGSHLHWEIRAGDIAIDPDLLLHGPLLDKAAIFRNDNLH